MGVYAASMLGPQLAWVYSNTRTAAYSGGSNTKGNTQTFYSVSPMWGYNHTKFRVDWLSLRSRWPTKAELGGGELTNTTWALACVQRQT